MRKVIRTEKAPVFNVPLSQGIKKGKFVFVSGQVGADPKTSQMVEGFEAQTRQVMDNLMSVLAAADCSKDDVVKCTVFLNDMKKFDIFNRIYEEYFDKEPPARSAFEVSSLALGYEIEVEAIAILD